MAFCICADDDMASRLREAVVARGRLTLLVPSFVARNAARCKIADAGLGLGVDVFTPNEWLGSLWGLLGDGQMPVASLQRQLLMTDVLERCDKDDLTPLRKNPGTAHLLASMARDLLPFVGSAQPSGKAEEAIFRLLDAYAQALSQRGLIEGSQMAAVLTHTFAKNGLPACACRLALADITWLPAYLLNLLAQVAKDGEVYWFLDADQACFADDITAACKQQCPDVVIQDTRQSSAKVRESAAKKADLCDTEKKAAFLDCVTESAPSFLEVAGPHARNRAYADEIARLCTAESGSPCVPTVAVVSPHPGELFDALAPYLVARGISAQVSSSSTFEQTCTGQQFLALMNLVERLQRVQAQEAEPISWWPAPELSDWLASPLSGTDAHEARRLDKKLRGTRTLSPDDLSRLLQSVQGRVQAKRQKLAEDNVYAGLPCVCSDVFEALCRHRFISALKAMLQVVQASPAHFFGTVDGQVRRAREMSMLERAIELLGTLAHDMGVAQDVACLVLPLLRVSSRSQLVVSDDAPDSATNALPSDATDAAESSATADTSKDAQPQACFMTLEDAAFAAPHSVQGIFFADMDQESYSLSRNEGATTALYARLGAQTLVMDAMARQRSLFCRALMSLASTPVFARVTHDGQARDCYASAIWTEAQAQQGALLLKQYAQEGFADALAKEVLGVKPPNVRRTDESDIVANLDVSAGVGMRHQRIYCLPPQELTESVRAYLLPCRLDPTSGQLSLRLLSASQIESYCTCPLCWFVSSRVRPNRLDAGFGGMEMGNFVHDVLHRFYDTLTKQGIACVTEKNVNALMPTLREVFEATRAEHAAGKTPTSAPLVALSTAQEHEIDQILPQLEAVLRLEAKALSGFEPRYLEYSFTGLDVTYAGRPLGGRIDRVDVNAKGQAVVIDYKHRKDAAQYRLGDPTVPSKRAGAAFVDDPNWLPQHIQTLIYAQALRHSSLDVSPQAALYLSTKSFNPAFSGAADAGLVADGAIPRMKTGFPDTEHGGTMSFDSLLDWVEDVVKSRLDGLEGGDIHAAAEASTSCAYNHALGFARRDA